jgi:hypothetical protein
MLKECQTNELPKQIAAARTEGTRKRGRRDGWRGEVEDDLNIIGIKNRQAMARVPPPPSSSSSSSSSLCWPRVMVLR